ncbi:GFA family protein [Hoeflea sp. WL0058]|uniref:GFA family protein n=1 Tax=Flavimaribacter sediminis TaxID=2865987 RepID=A0AAE2ZL25_9HYPH|nr:GFA family protein [Flavimaribacter sediminis]
MKRRGFCPICGSSVYMTFPDMPDVFIVTPASLDDPSRYKPQLATLTAAGYDWNHLAPSLQKFDRMPPAR